MRRLLPIVLVTLCTALPVQAATPFLWEPGAFKQRLVCAGGDVDGDRAQLGRPRGRSRVSSVGGSSGVFSNANTGQVIWSPMVLDLGLDRRGVSNWRQSVVLVPAIARRRDVRKQVAAPPRAPDVVFPLPAAALGGDHHVSVARAGAAAGIEVQGALPEQQRPNFECLGQYDCPCTDGSAILMHPTRRTVFWPGSLPSGAAIGRSPPCRIARSQLARCGLSAVSIGRRDFPVWQTIRLPSFSPMRGI